MRSKDKQKTTGKPKVFISHISEEAELARILKKHIQKAFLGLVDVFVSSDSASVGIGRKWMSHLDKALKSAEVEIILCSKESIKEPWINFEAGAGWVKDIPIVPVCHSGMRLGDLPTPLNHLQAIKANEESGLVRLYKLIAEKLHSAPPEINFGSIIAEIVSFEDKYATSRELKILGQEAVSDMPALLAQMIRFIEHLRAEEKLTELIQKVSLQAAFSNPFQDRVAAWRIIRAREQVERIQQRKWELEAMSPTAYVAYIFEGILELLEDGDEYWTVTNLDFWSDKAVGGSAFLDANVQAARRGASIKRVFIIGESDWRQDVNRTAYESLLEHKLACEKVNATGPGKIVVKYHLSNNLSSDLLLYGHFGLAVRPRPDGDLDDGCVLIVPRYESHSPHASISHLKLIFSHGPSTDVETIEYVNRFKRAFSIAKDLDALLTGPEETTL